MQNILRVTLTMKILIGVSLLFTMIKVAPMMISRNQSEGLKLEEQNESDKKLFREEHIDH